MNDNRDILKILIAATAAFFIGATVCVISLGFGALAVRMVVSRPQVESLVLPDDVQVDELQEVATPTPSRPAPDTPTPPPPHQEFTEIPANFDIFWEALRYLNNNFDGDVPQGDEITLAAAAGVLVAGEACANTASPSPPTTIYRITDFPDEAPPNFAYFWDSVNQVYALCGDEAPHADEIVFLALDGIIDQLDDEQTAVLPPDRAEDFMMELDSSFEGIGATVNSADGGGVLIVRPFTGSPAEHSGLKPFDVIMAVDHVDVTELTLDEAVRLIRGPAGSVVVLSIQRQGVDDPFDVEVTRARIDIPIFESEMLNDSILYMSLFDFSNRAVAEMEEALLAADDNVAGIVLDLRGNPGGLLDASIAIASYFIEDGIIVTESGVRNFEHDAQGRALADGIPLAILVDAGTASAAEIVAGAVQDHERGVLVGETTFGKGSVQSIFNLSDGSLLRVTTSRWFTPDSRQIDHIGLTPDIEAVDQFDTPEDEALDAALDYLLNPN
ncbi:MAG: S41 family peptidase [Caldilineales bacterium]|nr:S41 family peptidase [Caldilineales bacterium]